MALFRGENGAVFDIDPGIMTPLQREAHDAWVASGALVPVDPPKPKTAKAAAPKMAAASPPDEPKET